MRILLFIFLSLFLAGCTGNRVLEAKQTGKFFDRYFVLKKKRYKYYTKMIFNLSHMNGRYTISHDTIYLLTKKKHFYYMDGYAVLNPSASSVVVYGLDPAGSEEFRVMYDRRQGYFMQGR
ncbi:MAG: hypothetical protein WDO16_25375 [Bacteroidota bacterium]